MPTVWELHIFPFVSRHMRAPLAADQGNIVIAYNFKHNWNGFQKAGQTIEELSFAISEYFGNVYKAISQMNNGHIQENHEQWESRLLSYYTNKEQHWYWKDTTLYVKSSDVQMQKSVPIRLLRCTSTSIPV